jgi:hypothetical protein
MVAQQIGDNIRRKIINLAAPRLSPDKERSSPREITTSIARIIAAVALAVLPGIRRVACGSATRN